MLGLRCGAGVPCTALFFSSHDARTTRRLLAEAGLALLVDEHVTTQEPEGPQPSSG